MEGGGAANILHGGGGTFLHEGRDKHFMLDVAELELKF